jgi:predicted NodU family carbamoyl transferase
MLVLGINCCLSPPADDFMALRPSLYFHDAAAVLLRDGEVLAAIEQERLNRVKHTTAFAGEAMSACLEIASASLSDVEKIAFFFDEQYTDRELYLHYAAHARLPLRRSRELLADRIRERFQLDLPAEAFEFVQHHTAHAFSTYPQSGYDQALVVVMDGAGEDDAISVYDARGSGMEKLSSKEISHSLGYLYLAGTELLGYSLCDEYKVMGLAPYGNALTYRQVFDSLYELRADGDFQLDHAELQPRFASAGFRPRRRDEPFSQQHKDFAAGLQEVLEAIGWHVISHWQRTTGHRQLALAGGVGQNCTFNGRLLRSELFDDVFVHPAAHDAGAALGAGMKVHAEHGGGFPRQRIRRVFWGRDLPGHDAIVASLTRWKRFLTFRRCERVERDTAGLLAMGKVIGWVQGRSEFGPRALGNRSILADPRPAVNRDRVNRMIKQREAYRPFAPSVQAESLREYFEFPDGVATPDFMVFTVPVRPDKVPVLGAVTHVDGTARVHAVDRRVNERYWRLLEEFEARTGVPVLLNTSFNSQAEPIVDSVEDALQCYLTTRLDHLVIGDLIVSKLPWTIDDLCELVPSLTASARLRAEHQPGGRVRHVMAFDRPGSPEVEIGEDTYRVLRGADGTRTLRQLGASVVSEQVIKCVRQLWSDRYLTMAPASDSESTGHVVDAAASDNDQESRRSR